MEVVGPVQQSVGQILFLLLQGQNFFVDAVLADQTVGEDLLS